MQTIANIHVAYPGSHLSRAGSRHKLTKADTNELAQSYSPALHVCKLSVDDLQTALHLGAPAVLGHFDETTVQSKGAMPSFGKVAAARTDAAGNLFLDVSVTDEFAGWLGQGLYDRVSLSWYGEADPRNPTPGSKHIRHIGFLGAEPSAIKGLTQVPMPIGTKLSLAKAMELAEFSESVDDSEMNLILVELAEYTMNEDTKAPAESTVDPVAEAPVAKAPVAEPPVAPAPDESTVDPVLTLVSLLQDGDKGYKGEITGFDPEPTADNSFLWNADKQEFAGAFMDDSGYEIETYDFTLAVQGDGSLLRSYKMRQAVPNEPTDEEVQAQADAAELSEMPNLLSNDNEPMPMLQAQVEVEAEASTLEETAELLATVSVPMAVYEKLLAKASQADALMAEQAAAMRQQKVAQIADMLTPMYSCGLLPGYASADAIANAICEACDMQADCCDYEFSESGSKAKPIDILLGVLGIASKHIASLPNVAEVEFGELPEFQRLVELSEAPMTEPKGTVNSGTMASLHKMALTYCKANKLDSTKPKDYTRALKAVST